MSTIKKALNVEINTRVYYSNIDDKGNWKQGKKIKIWITSGYGFAWPEQWMCPPVLLENSILYGGSWTKIGPCKSNDAISVLFHVCRIFFVCPTIVLKPICSICIYVGEKERGRIFRLIAKWMVACAKSNIVVREAEKIKWKERERVHSPRMAYVDNKYRAIAFKRPHTPIFMSMFYAH